MPMQLIFCFAFLWALTTGVIYLFEKQLPNQRKTIKTIAKRAFKYAAISALILVASIFGFVSLFP